MVEALEIRRLLSTINWVNRVSADGFAIYGANTAIARAICDRAIGDWERVIENFNYSDGSNTYNLTLNAAAIGGRGQTANIQHLNGKPRSATVTIDDNAQGGGWYFDPVPGTALVPDDGEYQTSFPYEFAANNPITDNDFYRTVAHEIGHALGLSFTTGLLINTFTTDTGVDDPVSGGSATLRTVNFNGGPAEFTLTEMGGCHLYEGPAIPASGITQVHPNDMMNDGRTVGLNVNRRQLISDTLINLFQQAYGYTVVMPSQINTFYVNLNTTSDGVTINGDINGTGNDVDTILIEDLGTMTRFTVNGAVETIDNAEFSSIVINAGALDDTITIAALPAGKTVTVNAGGGTDTINVVETAATASVTILTSAGGDVVNVNIDNTGAAEVRFNSTMTLGALNVGNGGLATMLLDGTRVLMTRAISVNGSGKLDLNDNDLIVEYTGATQLPLVQQLIQVARTGGSWDGAGITSGSAKNATPANTTLGVMEAADYLAIHGGSTFAGQSIDTTAVLVKYTYYGDADFNGTVNFDDYSRADAGFNGGASGWVNGDFDLNGVVDFDDYSLIDLAFNTQGVTLRGRPVESLRSK